MHYVIDFFLEAIKVYSMYTVQKNTLLIFREDWMISSKTVSELYNKLYIPVNLKKGILSKIAKKLQARQYLQNFSLKSKGCVKKNIMILFFKLIL